MPPVISVEQYKTAKNKIQKDGFKIYHILSKIYIEKPSRLMLIWFQLHFHSLGTLLSISIIECEYQLNFKLKVIVFWG